jgi:hypothetical protein
VPAYWTAGRIANQIHRQMLGPHGFTRRGRECERLGGGLRKTLIVQTCAVSARPQIQLVDAERVADLLGVTLRTARRTLHSLEAEGLAWPMPSTRSSRVGRPPRSCQLLAENPAK